MASVSLQLLAEALYEETVKASEKEIKELTKNAVALLAKNKLLSKLPAFMRTYTKVANKKSETIEGEVISAHPLTEKEVSTLKKEIKERHKAKHVTLIEKEDRELIGGFKLKIGDNLYDQSIRGRMKQLQKALTH